MNKTTTFIIPTIDRPTLQRALGSVPMGSGYLFEIDRERVGEGEIRNRLIAKANTPWVSMLDDDDTVTPDYVQRLEEEIEANPDADVIIFREYFLHGVILPVYPVVTIGNIPISFSVRTSIAKRYLFKVERHEDYYFIQRLADLGYNIVFSKYLTYRARH